MPKPTFRKTAKGSEKEGSRYSTEKIGVGDIRKTQLITTFGVGAIVDFKDDTVVIASTDDWDLNTHDPQEVEDRKLFNENLSVITGAEYFLMPRTTQSTNAFSKGKNVKAYIFPEKQHCSRCGCIYDFRELDVRQRHTCPKCKNNLTASRFIAVCPNGHMDDFPYDWWVHNGKECSSGQPAPRILMKNIYNRTDIDSLRLECTACGMTRSMVQVFSPNALADYPCTCKHPHFKDPLAWVSDDYKCSEMMRARLRSASGVYFPVTKAALLIPPWSRKAVQHIHKHYELLKMVPEENILAAIRQTADVRDLTDEELLRSWKAAKMSLDGHSARTELDVQEDEYKVLSSDEEIDAEGFSAYPAQVPERYAGLIAQVTVADRLTVTQAFTGFTRISRKETDPVPISQYPKPWLPAVELMGEGIFLRFHPERVLEWYQENASRYRLMYKIMRKNRYAFNNFSEVYVLLHTFAHLFIREISNVCGYSAASIREKIYSNLSCDDEGNAEIGMCGILVYVSSPDSDSSLGGLISIADSPDVLERILDSMLERAQWCSADPLCISSRYQGYKDLNYAACHDCTLLPETSCERGNVFLDRAAIVGLPENGRLGFFGEVLGGTGVIC